MPDQRPGGSVGSTVLWFALSVVVMAVNFTSATRGSWLALLLGLLAAFFAYRNGKILYDHYRATSARRQR
jgi:mannose/fructose/N-acetylgalactosamine-specific phosphotransferase system component IID